jgi:hypothetical protein
VQADGVISHLDTTSGGDLAEAAETWRQAGGAIDLTEADLHKGVTDIGASGHLDLDALHRPHGRIDASGAGLEPILTRYGVPSPSAACCRACSARRSSRARPHRRRCASHSDLRMAAFSSGRCGLGLHFRRSIEPGVQRGAR